MGDSIESMVWKVLVVVALMGVGTFVGESRLRSNRPQLPAVQIAIPGGNQRAPARLWEDPFHAAQVVKDAPFHPVRCMTKEELGKTHIVLALTSGGRYSADTEQRLQSRYAAVMSLLSLGYSPLDAENIRAFTVLPKEREGPPQGSDLISVPYEWFRPPEGSDAGPVLILWVNEHAISGPVTELLGAILRNGFEDLWGQDTQLSILGPLYSDTLLNLAKTADLDAAWRPTVAKLQGKPEAGLSVDVYSFSATVPIDSKKIPDPTSVKLIRCTPQDDRLATALVDELVVRGVIPTCPTQAAPRIVLLSEGDSVYGRSLPTLFRDAVKSQGARVWSCDVFYYLRGLDGLTGGSEKEAMPAAAMDVTQPQDVLRRLLSSRVGEERPSGASQLDYLRRLVQQVKELDSAVAPVGAIGIFATDVYDKVVILEAMRRQFPGIVFFTTDVDAALLSPEKYASTRNLVVASGFDLSLGKDLQGEIPPFRQSYQSAACLAMNLMLRRDLKVSGQWKDLLDAAGTSVRVYEVGRSGFVDLHSKRTDDLHPKPPALGASVQHPKLLAGAAVCLLLLVLYWHHLFTRRDMRQLWLEWRHVGIACTGVMLVAAGLFAMLWIANARLGNSGEHLRLVEGTSAWPTEFLRFVIAATALCELARRLAQWRTVDRSIAEDLSLSTEPRGWGEFFRSLRVRTWKPGGNPVVFSQVWDEYRGRGQWYARLARSFGACLIFFMLVAMVFKSLPMPASPVRGSVLVFWDSWIAKLSAFAVVWLTFLVWDATRLCAQFIEMLADGRHDTVYPTTGIRHPQTASSELDIEIIGRMTESVGRALYYPLFLLLLMVVARSPVFDNWQWGTALALALTLSAAVAVIAAWKLKRSAEWVRGVELERLETKSLEFWNRADEPGKRTHMMITRALGHIRDRQDGAFAPWHHRTLLLSVVIPVAGIACIGLIEQLSNWV